MAASTASRCGPIDVTTSGLVTLALLVVVYALLVRKIATTALTGPILFMIFGIVAGPPGLDWIDAQSGVHLVSLTLEATLVVVLFTDAFNIDPGRFRDAVRLPVRLLGIGFPLMVVLGWGLAYWMFPQLGAVPALLVAVILAPTDAALGQAVMTNPRVPTRFRNALNVESGLNDGLALPIFFVVLAAASDSGYGGGIARTIFIQIGIAVLVGVVLGIGAGRLGVVAVRRNWTNRVWMQIAMVFVALAAWGTADGLAASGFIAAWVAGLSCGLVTRNRLDDPVGFADDLGNTLTLISFALFGAVAVGPRMSHLAVRTIGYALLSLFVVRMASVMAATARARLSWVTRSYLGWFGPRGLASIILVLVVVMEDHIPSTGLISDLMIATVGLSVVLHGATAWWASDRYGDWVSAHPDQSGAAGLPQPGS